MSSTDHHPEQPVESRAPTAVTQRPGVLVYFGRGCTLLTLLLVVLWTFRNWQFLLNPPVPEVSASSRSRNELLDHLAPVAQMRGTWTFDGVPWKLAVQTTSGESIDSVLEAASTRESFDSSSLDGEAALIELLEGLEIVVESSEAGRVFRYSSDDLRGFVRTTVVKSQERIDVARLAFLDSASWSTFELLPQEPVVADAMNTQQHLLPLPAESRQLLARHGDDGNLLLEAISVDATAGDLLRTWTAAGWTVHQPGIDDPALYCSRDARTISLWGVEENADGPLQVYMFDATGVQ